MNANQMYFICKTCKSIHLQTIHSSIISHRQINSECLCITKAALVSLYCADQELPLQTWGPCLL